MFSAPGTEPTVGRKCAPGPPVYCCTMARKFAVSVLNKVVGVRREALERLRLGFEIRPLALIVPVLELLPCMGLVVLDGIAVAARGVVPGARWRSVGSDGSAGASTGGDAWPEKLIWR